MNLMKRLCAVAVMISLAVGAGAQTFTVLKNFNSKINITGQHPVGTLVQGPDGTLYGVTTTGGGGGAGTVFRVQTNGTGFAVIKSFSLTNAAAANSDGATPQAGLVLSGGMLFGTASAGGTNGSGTVFSLGTNGGNFTVLKTFSALTDYTNSDGASPMAALILSNGVLYGSACYGGALGQGTLFRLNTNGTGFATIYTFTGDSDGANPSGRLLLSGNVLYGTAYYGGDGGNGVVFSVNTNGASYATLHSFSGSGTDGAWPQAGLVLSGSQLFGTTQHGDSGDGADDGTVFRVDINGNNFTTLHSFVDSEGWDPDTELLLSGSTLYGVTGTPYGTVFKVDTDGDNFETVAGLNITAGWGPDGGLVLSGGVLYGVTGLGGSGNSGLGNGVVYGVHTDGSSLTALVAFSDLSGGSQPNAGLTLVGSNLFGSTQFGGAAGNGAVFEIGTNGSGYSQPHEFSVVDSSGANADGDWPAAAMVCSGGTLYGTTRYGGTNGSGTVFKVNVDGTGFTNLYSFHGTQQGSPQAALVASGTALYGTTASGGGNACGAVFKINTDGTGFTNVYSFSGTDGKNPLAGLVLSGSTLYGTTYNGGTATGTVFQVNTDGSHFTNIYNFTGLSDGASPGGVLALSNGVLYGTTYYGGINGKGTVWKINADRTGFAVLHAFAGTGVFGSAGANDLVLSGNTLYGTTVWGGSSNAGCVFKLDTSGNNYSVLYNFTGGGDGANPMSSPVLVGNTLYGTTQGGGLSGQGTVFALTISSTLTSIPLLISRSTNAVVLTWSNPAFLLQAAPAVTGTFTNVPNASSPYTNPISGPMRFFRLQAN